MERETRLELATLILKG